MFVAKWEPGVIPKKPELTSAPIWLELRNVPLQFFNEEGLEHVAGLVGDPKFLHPMTANKTNLEVAKVFTIIDPRKPLPEAVNVQFDSGEIVRVLVSSPWMPPVCSHCKGIGHTLKRCSKAPVTCHRCNSTVHPPEACPRLKDPNTMRRQQKKHPQAGLMGSTKGVNMVYVKIPPRPELPKEPSNLPIMQTTIEKGESSGLSVQSKVTNSLDCEINVSENSSEVEADSSDTMSSDRNEDSGEEAYGNFQVVLSKRQRKVQRGKSLKLA